MRIQICFDIDQGASERIVYLLIAGKNLLITIIDLLYDYIKYKSDLACIINQGICSCTDSQFQLTVRHKPSDALNTTYLRPIPAYRSEK